jgi:hypothetical protein
MFETENSSGLPDVGLPEGWVNFSTRSVKLNCCGAVRTMCSRGASTCTCCTIGLSRNSDDQAAFTTSLRISTNFGAGWPSVARPPMCRPSTSMRRV